MLKTENPAAGCIREPGKDENFQDQTTEKHRKNQVIFDAETVCRIITAAGLAPPPEIIPDGSIHRFPSNGDKSDKAGYYCFFDNGGGFFGCWRAMIKQTVNPSGHDTWTDEQRTAFREKMDRTKAKAKAQREQEQAAAAEKARQIWESAHPAVPEHPYLKKKQIGTSGARETGDTLLIPIMDATGKIISLQSIDPTGKKKFFPGGQISGGYHIIGYGDFEHGGFIGEGVATGASINKATGKPVIIAFNSGNLPAVAKQFKHYPFVICADNDIKTAEKIGRNPGIDAAKKAADKSGLPYIVCPVDSDFNDLHCQKGLDAVKQALSQDKAKAADWPDPLPLFNSYEPEPFPIDALPPIYRNAVDEVRDYVQAPIPMIISSALGAASIAVQGHYDVKRDDGLTGPVSLFLWVVADSGERKTTVDNYFTAGIRTFESQKRQEMQPEIDAYERELKIYKAKEDGLLQAIKQAKASEGKANGKN